MRRRYPTDLADAEWEFIEPHLRSPNKRGRPKIHGSRHVLNAVFYVLRSGCAWRMLPYEFPPWRAVYYWFRRWRIDGTWERLNAALRERLRVRSGRNPHPSAGIGDSPAAEATGAGRGRTPRRSAGLVDSQTAKTTGVGGNERGFDPAKKVEGRKRHLLVDTEGLVLQAKVHSAKVPDQDGIRLPVERGRGRFARLSHLWVDAGYQGRGRKWIEEVMGLSVEVVRKPPKSRLPRRWPRSLGQGVGQGWQEGGLAKVDATERFPCPATS